MAGRHLSASRHEIAYPYVVGSPLGVVSAEARYETIESSHTADADGASHRVDGPAL